MSLSDAVQQWESFEAKVDRARHHLTDLHTQVAEFERRKKYEVSREIQADGRTEAFIFHVQEHPPLWLASIAGDFLHNCHAALDYLALGLHIVESGPPSADLLTKIAFPLALDKSKWSKVADPRIGGVSDPARTRIEKYQPYHSVNEPFHWLYELSRIDKHRQLHVLYHQFATVAFFGEPSGRLVFAHVGPLEDGTEIARFLWSTDPDPNVHFDFRCQVAFGHGAAADQDIYVALNLIFRRLLDVRDDFGEFLF